MKWTYLSRGALQTSMGVPATCRPCCPLDVFVVQHDKGQVAVGGQNHLEGVHLQWSSHQEKTIGENSQTNRSKPRSSLHRYSPRVTTSPLPVWEGRSGTMAYSILGVSAEAENEGVKLVSVTGSGGVVTSSTPLP